MKTNNTKTRKPPPGLRPGFKLRGYRIDSIIGGGGFSIVYKATRLADGAPVVIKEYLSSKLMKRTGDRELFPIRADYEMPMKRGIRRFFNEALALSGIKHPNIVQVIDVFRDNNTVYMVMHYETGMDLKACIKRYNGSLSPKFMRKVFPDLLDGLGKMHQQNLLHLDIKPANILMRNGGRPLLLDFGAAHNLNEQGETQITRTLTRGFAPVEQHENQALGPWTDIYALGASMYACITGTAPPVATERVVEDTLNVRNRSLTKRYPESLLDGIEWSLSVQPGHRPRNTDELLDFFHRMDREAQEQRAKA